MKLSDQMNTTSKEHKIWCLGIRNLCLRSGALGFAADPQTWAQQKQFTDNHNSSGYYKHIDPRLTLSLRVLMSELGRIKIPQLALYPPERGYPNCQVERTNKFKSYPWPYSFKTYHFTIPMLHINYGIATGAWTNVYSTFFSDETHALKGPIDTPSELSRVNGKYYTFPTGKNRLNYIDIGNNPAEWPVEIDLETPSAPTGLYTAMSRDLEIMNYDDFHRYLAYWMFYYPTITKDIRGGFGSTGDTKGPLQGNPFYISSRDDSFIGKGKVWKKYFGLDKGYKLTENLKLGWHSYYWKFTNVLRCHGQDYQQGYAYIENELWQELSVIRTRICNAGQRKRFKTFPFSSRPKHMLSGKTYVHESPIKQLSTIGQCRRTLDSYSQNQLVPGKKCPLCTKSLILPHVLASRSFGEEIMCVTCGYKALSNMHYIAVRNSTDNDDNCMWDPNIDMDAVLSPTIKIHQTLQSASTPGPKVTP